MTSTTVTPPDRKRVQNSLTSGMLPRWVPPAIVAGILAVGLAAGLLFDVNLMLAAAFAVVGVGLVLTVVSRQVEGARRAKDRLVTVVVTSAFVLALLPLVSLLITVVQNGIERFDGEFLTQTMRGVLGEGGGAYHAIVGTLLITAAAAVISVPIGIMCAVYLVEYGRGRLARAVTLLVDVMTGIPSIVAGLFAFAMFAIFFGPSVRFGIGGAVALSVLMVPVVVRSSEEMLKLVPNELREASYALGVSKSRTVVKVVLRTAAAGIATGVTLAVARVIGETAPLLIIAGSTTRLNADLFEGRMSSLPIFTYYSYTIPGVPPEFGVDRAWAAALTLFVIVMLLNLVARAISRYFSLNSR
ncbi:phosphate ABC transporter permease PstA [Micromonospora endolithica]|uniref:Phosphate transport system permease protein PstA n=1 Tax=Micromonospora endolithica TaxID=230091 RepID=A0A3A9YUA8_9ACTN|nr:phosphate ABC transporter permease PstA [Micromonospora endolithica]RKN39094.1 phosphate ABC transporter permease PstA [Micromonospora endolithica]TWJ25591.1 phosphate transport system permease protein [Micromonospora endolithica]